MQMPEIFREFVAAGMTGRKGNKGFYEYRKGRQSDVNPVAVQLQGRDKREHFGSEELQRRMVLLMINEAALCLDEHIVEDPKDVDFAMIMGTGFAPFRGGPLGYADASGVSRIVEDLQRLQERGEHKFTPCARLVQMSKEKANFYVD
jgi:3-hydroxyacyl-CoA dehydrogenase / enoyl-CoA hydratase / 3-hydroxybutyryl-CoA epimerase